MLHHSKNQNMTKIKKSKCNKNEKLKVWQKWKTQNLTKHTNFKCEQTQKFKIKKKLKNSNIPKLKKIKFDKTKKKVNWWPTLFTWIVKKKKEKKIW